ncbi:hypothetical protein VHUM_02059 [Vanrija humicola]|uniref:Uncharacterized protein n=1 Tax=Vanrija humicola TaxID=5417 RepID=A0A7D8V161_VANHU|nr:hypothetical protein VHUM_02059 [Vanrija humicola]
MALRVARTRLGAAGVRGARCAPRRGLRVVFRRVARLGARAVAGSAARLARRSHRERACEGQRRALDGVDRSDRRGWAAQPLRLDRRGHQQHGYAAHWGEARHYHAQGHPPRASAETRTPVHHCAGPAHDLHQRRAATGPPGAWVDELRPEPQLPRVRRDGAPARGRQHPRQLGRRGVVCRPDRPARPAATRVGQRSGPDRAA